jgi:hypothetical protein
MGTNTEGKKWGNLPCPAKFRAEQRCAADCLQRPLRSRFRQQLTG